MLIGYIKCHFGSFQRIYWHSMTSIKLWNMTRLNLVREEKWLPQCTRIQVLVYWGGCVCSPHAPSIVTEAVTSWVATAYLSPRTGSIDWRWCSSWTTDIGEWLSPAVACLLWVNMDHGSYPPPSLIATVQHQHPDASFYILSNVRPKTTGDTGTLMVTC